MSEQWAWAAGLFEGEGSIVHGGSGRQVHRRLSMQMNDRDILERFAAVVGCGSIRTVTRRHRVNRDNHSTSYCWEINRWADVEATLRRLLPHLGQRRTAKALALLADPAGPIGGPCSFSPNDVAWVRNLFVAGLSQSAIGRLFGVSQSTVCRVVSDDYPVAGVLDK